MFREEGAVPLLFSCQQLQSLQGRRRCSTRSVHASGSNSSSTDSLESAETVKQQGPSASTHHLDTLLARLYTSPVVILTRYYHSRTFWAPSMCRRGTDLHSTRFPDVLSTHLRAIVRKGSLVYALRLCLQE